MKQGIFITYEGIDVRAVESVMDVPSLILPGIAELGLSVVPLAPGMETSIGLQP